MALNDQTELNSGQISVRRGAHELFESFCRAQRDAGGPVGGGGPGWPRLKPVGEEKFMAGFLPDALVAEHDRMVEEEGMGFVCAANL